MGVWNRRPTFQREVDFKPGPVYAEGTAITTERIETKPAILMEKPAIRGTRITVELILRNLAEGTSEGVLLEEYRHLKTVDVRAAVAYGAASGTLSGDPPF